MSVNVLVTGGAGYIGSHTCKALARAGVRPIVYDNLCYGHRWAVRWGPLVEGDLADRDLLQRTLEQFPVAAVIHFAAFAYVGESVREPERYFRNNVINTLNLLEAMQQAGVRNLVFSSTCATYGVPERLPITEDHPQQPVNPYGESKLFVERALRWMGEAHGLGWAALRYFNAAGADPEGELGEAHDPETHLVPNAILAGLGRAPALQVFGTDYDTPDGTAVRDFVHVSDLADAHVRAVTHLLANGDNLALNLGTGQGHSVREVIAAVERAGAVEVPFVEAPRRAGDPPRLVADPTQAASALGWRPHLSDLDSIVSSAWAWHARGEAARGTGPAPHDDLAGTAGAAT